MKEERESHIGTEELPSSQIALDQIVGYDALDNHGDDIGNVTAFWTDHRGRPAFIGVRTLWMLGKTHVVPAFGAEVNHARKQIRVPFTNEDVKGAPHFDPDAEIDASKEREVMDYFHGRGVGMPYMETYEERQTAPRAEGEEVAIPLHEEELNVGKRTVEAGGLRLRKIVRTETVQQPVEIKREDVVIERVPAGEREPTTQAFEGEEIFIPLWREEPVIAKEVRVREEVRARKTEERESRNVSGEIRKEDVEIEDERKNR